MENGKINPEEALNISIYFLNYPLVDLFLTKTSPDNDLILLRNIIKRYTENENDTSQLKIIKLFIKRTELNNQTIKTESENNLYLITLNQNFMFADYLPNNYNLEIETSSFLDSMFENI